MQIMIEASDSYPSPPTPTFSKRLLSVIQSSLLYLTRIYVLGCGFPECPKKSGCFYYLPLQTQFPTKQHAIAQKIAMFSATHSHLSTVVPTLPLERGVLSLKSICCLFQNIQYFAIAYNIPMAFSPSKIDPHLRGASLPAGEEWLQQNNSLWSQSAAVPSSLPVSGNIQQKKPDSAPRRHRNVVLRPPGEPSEEKMRRITERRTSYKRSTNNSHKKFICVARRLLGKLLGRAERAVFEEGFQEYRNSRTYYFIILVHVKLLLPPEGVEAFRREFRALMQNKIEYYRKELARTDNRNFIHFRCHEIADIEYALTALDLFLEERVEEAVQTIYKRDRAEVLKKQQFEAAVQVVGELEGRLRTVMRLRGQVQDVIILQQNATPPQLQQEEKSTLLQQEGQKMEQSQSPPSFTLQAGCSFVRTDRVRGGLTQKEMPLLFLENSYPFYEYFFPIMFPYQVYLNPLNANYPQNSADLGSQQEMQGSYVQKMVENGQNVFISDDRCNKGGCFVGKTAPDEQQKERTQFQ